MNAHTDVAIWQHFGYPSSSLTHSHTPTFKTRANFQDIYSTGAADEGKYYPNEQYGAKFSGRWASIVFARVEDAADVVDLYGGADEAGKRMSMYACVYC